MIIHIAGPRLSGKTVTAKRIKSKHGKIIMIVDLDMFLERFLKTHNFFHKAYQNYINEFIDKHKSRNILFIGLNQDGKRTKILYDLKAEHKIFIDYNVEQNARAIFSELTMDKINDLFQNPKTWVKGRLGKFKSGEEMHLIYNAWHNDEETHNARLADEIKQLSPSGIEKQLKELRKLYKQEQYKFLTMDKIPECVAHCLKFMSF